MRRTIPIPERPEFTVLEYPGWLEYRVQAPGATAKFSGLGVGACVVLGVAYFWQTIISSPRYAVFTAVVVLFHLYSHLTNLLWESVVILPSLGIQLETHRGFLGFPLFAARRFIPWSSLEDFLINEGIRGWDIRYYLVALHRTQQGALKLDVAFESILPRFPILLKVYHGVREALQTENERANSQIHSTDDSSRSASTDSGANK
ncbi:uncharacterized protein TRAVEDRAFT_164502 [Trametes versicolor FP-101664 SS1]|uniref:uncharacterized protein n=1 Tax=Trametes versicolor (strain FP-101664) TaxID=717944 RepID=UPI000462214A|nr:uncharacterized protein TRAVEDRAFT_164502 [Trametes versicolor FP-101664 SS1]EIW60056.1 hypothetical protein TRAVEDRAFT_164502 [Trametes versicolor FP-101664 SS1]